MVNVRERQRLLDVRSSKLEKGMSACIKRPTQEDELIDNRSRRQNGVRRLVLCRSTLKIYLAKSTY